MSYVPLKCCIASVKILNVAGSGDAAVISFESTTGNRIGFIEARTITDVRIVRFLSAVMEGMNPGDSFITGTGQQFRTDFAVAMRYMGLSASDFKPYSIRRGGATADYRSHGIIERTQIRGGWADGRTTKIYISESLALLSEHSEDNAKTSKVRELSDRFLALTRA